MNAMRKILAVLLTLSLIAGVIPAALAIEESIVDESVTLQLGENKLTLLDAEYTLYLFTPEEIGVYTLSVSEGATIGYWGAGTFFYNNPNSTANSIEQEIKAVGQQMLIGVASKNPAVTLTIEKTGESAGYEEIVYTDYENVHTPSVDNAYAGGDKLTAVNIAESHTAVLGDDGFYHLDTVYGGIIYVNLITNGFNILSVFGLDGSMAATRLRAEYNGTHYDFLKAMNAYALAVEDTDDGIYPLTTDLMIFLQAYGTAQGWYTQNLSSFEEIQSGEFDPETAWMVTCLAGEPIGEPEPIEVTIPEANQIGAAQESNVYTEQKYIVTGVIVEIANTTYGNMYIEDEAGNRLYIYGLYSEDGSIRYDAMEVKPVVGDQITVMSGLGNYKGDPQMKNACLMELVPGVGEPEPEPEEVTIPDANAIAEAQENKTFTTEKYIVTGVVVEIVSTTYGNLYIEDAEGNQLYVYGLYSADGTVRYDKMEVQPAVGDTVTVVGILGNYNGAQMKNGWLLSLVPGEPEPEPEPEEVSVSDAIAIGAAKEHNRYTAEKYIVTGIITEIASDVYGNMYIADDQGNTLYIYGLYNADGSVRFDALEVKPAVGDTVTVLGVLGQYNGTAQMKNGWLLSLVPGEPDLTCKHPNLQHQEAVAPSCNAEGNVEYWYCEDCMTVYLDAECTKVTNMQSVKIPAAHTGLKHVEAVAATCNAEGNVEYWYCEDCMTVYLDAECTKVTNMQSVKIPAAGHAWGEWVVITEATEEAEGLMERSCANCGNKEQKVLEKLEPGECKHPNLQHVEAVAPSCNAEGNVEYWYCEDCMTVYLDAECTKVTNMQSVKIPAAHTGLKHVEAVAATCEAEGNVEYWYCEDCMTVYLDAECTKVTNMQSVKIPAAHTNLQKVEAVAPSCDADGNVEYWFCADCQMVYLDADCTVVSNMKNVTIPAAHTNLQKVEAVAPSCDADGNVEYWFCSDCGMAYLDAECTKVTNLKNVVIPAAHTGLKHVEAVAPTCTSDGNVEYWFCADCQMVYLDADCTVVSNMKNVVVPAAHTGLQHVEAQEAGCCMNGNLEYWFCVDCEMVYLDADCTIVSNMKNIAVPFDPANIVYIEAVDPCHANGHAEYWQCVVCESIYADAGLTKLTNIKALTILADTELTFVEGYEAGCHQNGLSDYWYCAECDCYFTDAEGKHNVAYLSLVIPFNADNIEHVAFKEPTRGEDGHYEYWHCKGCDAIFSDAALTKLTNIKNLTIPAGSTVVEEEVTDMFVGSGEETSGWSDWTDTNTELKEDVIVDGGNLEFTVSGTEILSGHIAVGEGENMIVIELDISQAKKNADGSFTFSVSYAEIVETFGSNFSALGNVQLGVTTSDSGSAVIEGLQYVIPAEIIPPTGDFIALAILSAMMSATGLVVLGKKKH